MSTSTKTQSYICYAEHCNGMGASHSCSGGLFFDPTDMWEVTVDAIDEDHARDLAKLALEQEVIDFEPCSCPKAFGTRQVGSPAWWDSVAIVVEVADSE